MLVAQRHQEGENGGVEDNCLRGAPKELGTATDCQATVTLGTLCDTRTGAGTGEVSAMPG